MMQINIKQPIGIKNLFGLIFTVIILLCLQIAVFAASAEQVLTVDTTLNVERTESDEEHHPESDIYAATISEIPWVWHPISVINEIANGFNTVRKIYALPPDVNPTVISTENFHMFGQQFSFAYVIQHASSHENAREVRETVTIDTTSRNINDILPYLEQTIAFDRDGYTGILTLNLQSISSQAAGTTTTTNTATRQRTFPHMSSPDNSLVPRTITDGGITFHLASVDWSSGTSTSSIDGHAVSSTFTATATFTTQVTNTRTTGYTTTAEYVGTVFRTVPDAMIYTVNFYGAPAVEEISSPEVVVDANIRHQIFHDLPMRNDTLVPQAIAEGDSTFYLSNIDWVPMNSLSEDGQSSIRTYTASATFTRSEAQEQATVSTTDSSMLQTPRESREPKEMGRGVLILLGSLLGLAVVGAGGFFLAKHYYGYNVTVYSVNSPGDVIRAGKIKVDFEIAEPVIDIEKPASKYPAKTERYIIQLAQRAATKIAGKTVRIVLGDKEASHAIPSDAGQMPVYEFSVDFSDDDEDCDNTLHDDVVSKQ